MAIFTLFWFGTAASNFDDNYMWVLFIISKKFPQTVDSDKTTKRKNINRFGWVFGFEGILIAICVLVLKSINHQELIIPVIAIIVGLHFFPMASVFRRSLDYYTASFATVLGLTGLILTLNQNISISKINILVGIVFGLVTTFYGVYMIVTSQKIKPPYPNISNA